MIEVNPNSDIKQYNFKIKLAFQRLSDSLL